jgi:hypothetical protein
MRIGSLETNLPPGGVSLLLEAAQQPHASGIDIRDVGQIECQIAFAVGNLFEVAQDEMDVGAAPIAFEMNAALSTIGLVVNI